MPQNRKFLPKVCLALDTVLDRDRISEVLDHAQKRTQPSLEEVLPRQLAQGKKKIEGTAIKAPCNRFDPTGFTHLRGNPHQDGQLPTPDPLAGPTAGKTRKENTIRFASAPYGGTQSPISAM